MIMVTNRVGKPYAVLPFVGDPHKVEMIYEIARDKSPESRKELMQLVCDILQVGGTTRESELVADILIELLQQAEKDLRLALSMRLSHMQTVPLRLVLELANDEIEIASPVLKNSPVLGDMDLIYIIKSKSAEYWRVIAQRKNLSDFVVETLAETGDFGTAIQIVENNDLTLNERTLLVLSDLAQGNEALSTPLLRRDEITKDIADKLYMYVGERMKSFIRDHYSEMIIDLVDAVDQTVEDFTEQGEEDKREERRQNLTKDASAMMHKGALNVHDMMDILRSGQVDVFQAQFAAYTGLDMSFVSDMIQQASGQKLALACKAFGINKADFVSFYLLTSKMRENGAIANVNAISKSTAYYERVDAELARRIVTGAV